MNALNLSDRHVDETVEFDTSRLGAAQPQLQIIEGTGPDLSRETWQLLKFRLRTASLLLFGGYAAFLLWGLFTNLAGQSEKPIVFGLHVLATCVTGMIGMRLCNNCPTLLKHLRLAEALVFGTSGAVLRRVVLSLCPEVRGARPSGLHQWPMVLAHVHLRSVHAEYLATIAVCDRPDGCAAGARDVAGVFHFTRSTGGTSELL